MISTNVINLRQLMSPLLVLMFTLSMGGISAAPVSDIRQTKHNLSVSGPGDTKADTESQVCVFCHTPHAATVGVAPLWNRVVGADTYTRYTSSSLDANDINDGFNDQPAGSSLLCLSCHDGQVALGNVNVLNGIPNPNISVNNSTATTMPTGMGSTTGFTRHIGEDLTNDHPISITFNEDLVTADGELRPVDGTQKDIETGGEIIGVGSVGYRPKLPLEPTSAESQGQVQCATCHDPHLFDPADPKRKFLRLNRFQKNASPTNDTFNPDNDIICLGCHKKSMVSWGMSAHADSIVADEAYTDDAAALREFPPGTQVWQAGCLNCHDTHTVSGSRRLLREGTYDSAVVGTGSGQYKQGFASGTLSPGIESTCWQCHKDVIDGRIVQTATGEVPAVKTLFELPYGMPVGTGSQVGDTEVHDIKDGNMLEDATTLGRNNLLNRHAECTDCHNPHRVRRGETFDKILGTKRTHDVGGATGNIASGVLRGSWGVEPVYFGTPNWLDFPDSFDVKKGDPGNATPPTSSFETNAITHLTREYQLCFKCHSNYSTGDTKDSFPLLGYGSSAASCSDEPDKCDRGTQPSESNGLLRYTNVAAEFASVNATDPATTGTDQGSFGNSGTACGGGDCEPPATNHRSWHPVMYPTGRDRAERGMNSTGSINLLAPFEANIGKQTMHCSDCHGHAASWTDGTGPNTEVQGPHGSSDPFLLRGPWNSGVSLSRTSYEASLCGNCHDPRASSGFDGNHVPDSNMSSMACMNCHVAIPHGWKNKAFLMNLNCVGNEINEGTLGSAGCSPSGTSYTQSYDQPPYYYAGMLRLSTWQQSGGWGQESHCGGDAMTDCRD